MLYAARQTVKKSQTVNFCLPPPKQNPFGPSLIRSMHVGSVLCVKRHHSLRSVDIPSVTQKVFYRSDNLMILAKIFVRQKFHILPGQFIKFIDEVHVFVIELICYQMFEVLGFIT